MGIAHRKPSKPEQLERDQRIVELYRSGLQQSVIAQRMSMSQSTVKDAICRMGARDPNRQRVSDPFVAV
jgi:DNA-binding NarL/FixJ family response regulator